MPKHKRKHSKKSSQVRDVSKSRSRSRERSPSRSSHRDELASTLKEIFTFMKDHYTQRPSESIESREIEGGVLDPSLLCDAEVTHAEATQADEQPILQNRGAEPGAPIVLFAESPRGDLGEDLAEDKENNASLANELFGERSIPSETPWESVIFDSTKNEVFSGLKEDVRLDLLSKYELKENLTCLGPPKLNKEIRTALSKHHSVLKRDEYQSKAQQQVGACLNALGTGISELLKLYQERSIDEDVKSATAKLAEGIHLLADHQYRLSLARQSVIKPCLTFVGKSAVDHSSVDEWLFGSTLAEDLKSAQALEKAGRDLLRSSSNQTASTAAKVRYQPPQLRPVKQLPANKGNFRAPAPGQTSSSRRPGAVQKTSRSQPSRPRSRSRPRARY